jgi:Flp pilus assembly protein TadG
MTLKTLARNRSGNVAIEFAILGPAVMAMMFGVVEVGRGMQAYNSLRSIAAETARYATVEYQKSNTLTNTALQSQARAIAVANRYRLATGRLTVTVTTPATQRVTGVGERTLALSYNFPTTLKIYKFTDITVTYTRPIFIMGP